MTWQCWSTCVDVQCGSIIDGQCWHGWWAKQRCWWAAEIDQVVSRMTSRNTWADKQDDWCSADRTEWWAVIWTVDKAEWWAVLQQSWCNDDMCILYCKSKLVLLLRLGYLKPFLAGSKKTRQGPGCWAGALFISRCWFRLTVVAGPNNIKRLQIYIVWCSSVLWFFMNEMLMLYEWCLWNDYGRVMEWWIDS